MKSLVCAALLVACSSPARPTAPVPPPPPGPVPAAEPPRAASPPTTPAKVMTGDTPAADSDGNTFIAPDGWTLATAGTMTVLTSPEGDSRLALVDVSADSNDAARDAAWKIYKPDARWPLLASNDVPDRDGWTRGKASQYQPSPNEKRAVRAVPGFAGGRGCVVLVDFAQATAEKRGGQIGKIFNRLFPKGYA